MSRISEAFDKLRAGGRRGLIPYITVGDPDLETSRALIVELARAGATLVELGVPFSDPVADGPTIQRAAERALRHGVGVADVLRTLAEARRETDVPVILFSYFNPLLQFGVERLAGECVRAGVETPKPTATGRPVTPRTRPTSRSASPLISVRAPVTPARETA